LPSLTENVIHNLNIWVHPSASRSATEAIMAPLPLKTHFLEEKKSAMPMPASAVHDR
jgi:hypothetical protein